MRVTLTHVRCNHHNHLNHHRQHCHHHQSSPTITNQQKWPFQIRQSVYRSVYPWRYWKNPLIDMLRTHCCPLWLVHLSDGFVKVWNAWLQMRQSGKQNWKKAFFHIFLVIDPVYYVTKTWNFNKNQALVNCDPWNWNWKIGSFCVKKIKTWI